VIKAIGHGDVREPDLKRRLDKWSGISAELYKYDGKKPGNSVAGLEGLLLQTWRRSTSPPAARRFRRRA